MDNWLPGILRIAFGPDDPQTTFNTMLAALLGGAVEPAEEEAQLDEAAGDPGPSLTAVEEEGSRLLADRDSAPDPPAQPL